MQTKELSVNIEKTVSRCPVIINDINDMTTVSAVLRDINALIKEVDKTFNPIVSTALKAHKEALAQKKKHREPLEERKMSINNMIVDYNQREAKKQLENKEEKIEKAQEEMDYFGEIEAEVPAEVVVPKGMHFKESWSAEVVDLDKLDKKYMLPNMTMLNGIARATKGQEEIAGVKYNCKKTPIVR